MKVIIPAAGEGTRLRPHTITKPKPILPIAGSTIIDFIMNEISSIQDLEEVIFIVGYLKDKMIEYLTDKYKNITLRFVEQKEYKGLAHAISLTKEYIKDDDKIFIILGDTIFKLNLSNIVSKNENSLGVCEVDNPSRFGIAILNEQGIITKLIEKPQEPIGNLALTGMYNIVNTKELFEAIDYIIKNDIKTKNEYQLTDALEYMIKNSIIFKTFKLDGWYDCGEKSTMIETNRSIIKHDILSKGIKDTAIIPPVFIDKDVKIENSVIGPYVHIGKNSKIENSILKNCIIFEDVSISNAFMDNSIISEKVKYIGKTTSMDIGASITIEQN
ncbi:sugar phosphate nucleotidyltransferase [Brachyspira hampsonii]|uniref:Nucleotidyltransferase n=1 Tax=Brachyspira hampsonii 30446 TaxID=1289135 RepID=A0A2U4F1L5_9SPIR|nr:sugar phosphate nucleotidyltransferase [Brachyspira hampsonii]EKV57109.1 nucleotidyltransferase [Brachyspira hampsonii 30446]MBW5389237.1 nucleotidyltransferase [Brachyspira hampsonii]MBW5394186.1 nucleotidyltransferase [Brachyspira hampsonii]OEJ16912.1 nucleotidyltransferase [Brachyspira hampsonii]